MAKKSNIQERRSYAMLAGPPDLVFKLQISSSEFLARLDALARSDDNSHHLDLIKYGSMDYSLRRNIPAILNPFQVAISLRLFACTDGTELVECRWRLNPSWDGIVRVVFFVACGGAAQYSVEHTVATTPYASMLLAGVFIVIGIAGMLTSFMVHLAKVFDRYDMHDMEFLLMLIKDAAEIDDLSKSSSSD